MRKSDVEEPEQCSAPNMMQEDIRPGQRFVLDGVRYVVLSNEKGIVLIEREDKGCKFTYGAEALMRFYGVRWIRGKEGIKNAADEINEL